MRVTSAFLTAFAFLAGVSAHNPQVLSTSASRRLHQTRSLCSRDVNCILAHEATEGPYYIPDPLLRTNITEDRDGVPLKLTIAVTDITKCAPASGVWVDIWHADAHGEYSGWASGKALAPRSDLDGIFGRDDLSVAVRRGLPQEPSRFLRGVAVTDEAGSVVFDTIMPGWYAGRTTHIHIRVHSGAVEVENGTLVGAERVAHTGQLFFADKLVKELAANTEPYVTHAKKLSPMFNGDDGIYLHSEGEEQVVLVEQDGNIFTGLVGVGIDPEADHHHDEGFGGGPPGSGRIAGAFVLFVILAGGVWAVQTWRKNRAARYVAVPSNEEYDDADNH